MRSLRPKIRSMIDYFKEMKGDISIITESWLRDGQDLHDDLSDLDIDAGIACVLKNRGTAVNGKQRRRGGVAIFYTEDRMALREEKIPGNKYELVAVADPSGAAG